MTNATCVHGSQGMHIFCAKGTDCCCHGPMQPYPCKFHPCPQHNGKDVNPFSPCTCFPQEKGWEKKMEYLGKTVVTKIKGIKKNKIRHEDIGKKCSIKTIQLVAGKDPYDIPTFTIVKVPHHWRVTLSDDGQRLFDIDTIHLTKPQ